MGSIPGWGRSPGRGHGNPLQYSCLGESHWPEEPDGQQSIGSQRAGHDRNNLAHTHHATAKTRHSQINKCLKNPKNGFGGFTSPKELLRNGALKSPKDIEGVRLCHYKSQETVGNGCFSCSKASWEHEPELPMNSV